MPFLREAGMNDFFPRLLIASLVCFGWWNAFAPGMVFGWIADVLETRTPEWIQKPLYACPPCLASTVGTIMWFYLGGDFTLWVPFVLALSGFNRIVASNLLK
jgi:uncharacterized membrane protein YeiH